ncbi:hypothetical protein HAZT_HAZT009263 [Hyalella azteca]|uniref:Uncharacterized protein n=1 Tax=Hyalella azteca TaxID=294128 RepID=A0A6A0H4E3_HYAAZ|nr:hypothetical protein HAZT_HAZT009263 [Hyalella azteca]
MVRVIACGSGHGAWTAGYRLQVFEAQVTRVSRLSEQPPVWLSDSCSTHTRSGAELAQLASSYIRALSNMLKESEKDNLMNDGTHQKTSASSSVGRPNLAPHEFNNNTSLSNMNFESEDKKNSAWDVKFESKENTSCSDEAAAGADFSLDTFLAREAADASSCAVAGPRLQPNSDDQQHNDEEIILWNDISSDQNFNWDSN